ncbi:galectin-6-like isoform X4 [Phyllopteryx taeniolatus]|uniref:galectin-6-like isoform X4 n=1 Tax=Phyllopteryx taeniolatus TaxID=161469 RepID=UPI002AD54FE0|nr:galectin-6-like isoform X4 [Phyllopteryx taeniolatus]
MSFLAPPGYQPVYGPTIPYLGPIYGGLREGASIYFQGSVPDNITRFFVNLLCGPSESSDIALHFNPRFDGWDKVVFNSRQNNTWDAEEKIRDMPFSKGEAFEMVAVCSAQGYQFKINGKDFHTFKHRLPLARVCGMQIGGDVSIQTINVIGQQQGGYPGGSMGQQGGYPGGSMGQQQGDGTGGRPGCGGGYPGDCGGGGYPGGMGGSMGGGFPGSSLPSMGGQPIYNPPIPYSGVIPGGMFPKRTVIIRGTVPYQASRFSINFLASRSGDIAFHINPRARDGVVVRNSMIGGRWGQEERQLGASPFQEGQYFDLSIRCGSDRFKVFIDGQPLFDFTHRTCAVNDIDKLEVAGDVQISYIHF